MSKRTRKLTVVMVLASSLGAGMAPAAYADHGDAGSGRVEPARPAAPPPFPPGLVRCEREPSQCEHGEGPKGRIGPIKEEPV